MPVYGLPLSLEASLNSLIELRPPTSWRVSGHSDDVTVVLRWNLCGSPSSEKTLDYEVTHSTHTSATALTRPHLWTRKTRSSKHNSPASEGKTRSRCSSRNIVKSTHQSPQIESCFQPLKIRKIESLCPTQPPDLSPVPLFITRSESVFTGPPSDPAVSTPTTVCVNPDNSGYQNAYEISIQNQSRSESVENNHDNDVVCIEDNNTQHSMPTSEMLYTSCHQSPDIEKEVEVDIINKSDFMQRTTPDLGPDIDKQIRNGIREYLAKCASNHSSPARITLDEASGLLVTYVDDEVMSERHQLDNNERRYGRSTPGSGTQSNSRHPSESSSTSLSWAKYSSTNSSSQDDNDNSECASDDDETPEKSRPSDDAEKPSSPMEVFHQKSSTNVQEVPRSPSGVFDQTTVTSGKLSRLTTRSSDTPSPFDALSCCSSQSGDTSSVAQNKTNSVVQKSSTSAGKDSLSKDLEISCSNEAEQEQCDVLSSSSSDISSLSPWESFEKLQDDVEGTQEKNEKQKQPDEPKKNNTNGKKSEVTQRRKVASTPPSQTL